MTRAGARRRQGDPVAEADGPDPAEDPILYLYEEDRAETKEDKE